MSSVPYSSIYNPSIISTFSISSNHNSLFDDIDPDQTRNVEVFMTLMDNRQIFTEIGRLVQGKTAFQRLFTINHIHSTI